MALPGNLRGIQGMIGLLKEQGSSSDEIAQTLATRANLPDNFKQVFAEAAGTGLSDKAINDFLSIKVDTGPLVTKESLETKGPLGSLGRFFGPEKLGRRIAGGLVSKVPERHGGARETFGALEEQVSRGLVDPESVQTLRTGGVSNRELAGSIAQTGLSVAAPFLGKTLASGTLAQQSLKSGVLGAAFGTAGSLEEGNKGDQLIKDAAIGAVIGASIPVVIEGVSNEAGGQLMLTTEVENWPGFDSILGPDLIKKLREHAKKFGAELITENVTEVDFKNRPFTIKTAEKEYKAKAVIISTGAKARMLGLPAEDKLLGHGLSTCATCDAFFYKDKEVVVVGGGDSALEEASTLTKFASKVFIVHRRDKLRASKIMQDRTFKNEKIEFIWDTVVEDILDVNQNKVTGVKLKNLKTGEVSEKPIGGVFIAYFFCRINVSIKLTRCGVS